MLAFAGLGVSLFYIAYHSILFRRHQGSAHTSTPPINWQQSVEVSAKARPHVRKMRNGFIAIFVCFIVAAAANFVARLVGY
jgi:hypothetical protein